MSNINYQEPSFLELVTILEDAGFGVAIGELAVRQKIEELGNDVPKDEPKATRESN